jgi:thiosulfate/3-mercaptopyruvate sulfurtransferase
MSVSYKKVFYLDVLKLQQMVQKIKPIIKASELLRLRQATPIILIDARVGAGIKETYAQRHLEGALFVDLETQLADKKPDSANGGRHPLPQVATFSSVLATLGISSESHVVVYDDKNGGNAAARFWWMLRAIGHSKVQVLDGGMDKASEAGYPLSIAAEKQPELLKNAEGLQGYPLSIAAEKPMQKKNYPIKDWLLPLADIEMVERVAQNDDYMVIDVRDAYRYNGESEPIDLIAGHIPGAVNVPFTSNLDEQGYFLSPSQLKEKYIIAFNGIPSERVIVHCGSGVTACHTLLAMEYAELEIPKLYVGSWSEWSRTERPIATL